MKRVITGGAGKDSVFADITEVADLEVLETGGMEIWSLWGVDGTPRLPFAGSGPEHSGGFYPPPGNVRINYVRFGPDLEGAAEEEANEVAEVMDDEGTHATDTMDIGFLVSGELGLELPNGDVQWLTAGDMIIQHGTIHKWLNRSGESALTAWVVLGAERA